MFISFFMSKRCRLTLPARPTRWRCARTCSGCCPRCPTSGPSSRPAQQHWCSVRRENVQIFFNRISSHLSPQHFLLLFKLNDVFPAIYNSVQFIRWQTRTQLKFREKLRLSHFTKTHGTFQPTKAASTYTNTLSCYFSIKTP